MIRRARPLRSLRSRCQGARARRLDVDCSPVHESPRPHPFIRSLRGIENAALIVAFLLSMLLPLIDTIGRPLGNFYVPGGATYRAQLTLWLAFIGGLLATRERQHLTLSSAEAIGRVKMRDIARLFSSSV